jgi:hypothetical protein
MKRLFITILIATCFIVFYSCNNNNESKNKKENTAKDSTNQVTKTSESNTDFPFEKAKQAVLQKGGIHVYGFHKESDTKVYMFLSGRGNEDWIQEFDLITTDKNEQVWFMGQHSELSCIRFQFIK